jgi:putative spermidine/putrescine transport system permease protein
MVRSGLERPEVRSAFWLSINLSVFATLIALVLGTLVAFGLHRFKFYGRGTVSLLLVLPIALPGMLTGLALQSTVNLTGVQFSIYTIVIGHTTFCIVVIFNNVIARLRRTSTSLIEASSDLGDSPLQTFRLVTFPMIRTAFISGALLAFALSFEEVIVTAFTAGAQNMLPLWIFGAILLGQQLPEVNAAVVFVLLCMSVPLIVAAGLTGSERVTGTVRGTPKLRLLVGE